MTLGGRVSLSSSRMAVDTFRHTLNLNQWESLRFSENPLIYIDSHWFKFRVAYSGQIRLWSWKSWSYCIEALCCLQPGCSWPGYRPHLNAVVYGFFADGLLAAGPGHLWCMAHAGLSQQQRIGAQSSNYLLRPVLLRHEASDVSSQENHHQSRCHDR